MNILVTSIGSKVPLLKCVKASMSRYNKNSRLFGSDIDPNCIGQFFVDHFWLCPSLTEASVDEILDYCKQHDIKSIFLTRDEELVFYSRHREYLAKQGIFVMVSDENTIMQCTDKLLFYSTLTELRLPVIPTFTEVKPDYASYVIKERCGSGSRGIELNISQGDAELAINRFKMPIVQPYIQGDEYSIDAYISIHSREVIGIIARRRIKVVDGEARITKTCRNAELENICKAVVQNLGLIGHVMLQVIIDKYGKLHIVECNARFGGASTLSIAAGLDTFYWFISESAGNVITQKQFRRSLDEKTLIRHMEDMIL